MATSRTSGTVSQAKPATNHMTAIAGLSETVLKGGYCIGCGVCTAVQNSPFKMKLDDFGRYTAALDTTSRPDQDSPGVALVCPFSQFATDESTIAAEAFHAAPHDDPRIGRYYNCYAGYVKEANFRNLGSSGGVGKWILSELLATGAVDTVIQVSAVPLNADGPVVYQYEVMRSIEDVVRGSKSAYHPVEMSRVLNLIRETPGRYAITGVPCFVKALRLLARHEPLFRERILFTIGIVCGHLKSARYAEMLGWQVGVPPGELGGIDFRKKIPGKNANEKGIEVWDRNSLGRPKDVRSVRTFFGGPYNLGFFQYRACDYCDDVVAETADVSVGDAWLPEYITDSRGTSVVIVRNRVIQDMIDAAVAHGKLHLEAITADQAAASQAGGFRQRREGLAYRLHLAGRRGIWHPPKRVKASEKHLNRRRQKIYEVRTLLSESSHVSFELARSRGDFAVFKDEMQKLLVRYEKLTRAPLLTKVRSYARRTVQRLLRALGLLENKA